MASFEDFYAFLHIQKTDDQDAIKKAYRTLAKKFHPDKNQGNIDTTEMFLNIQKAYEVLSDAKKKSDYDNKYEYHMKKSYLSHKRKKMIDDLLNREKEANSKDSAKKAYSKYYSDSKKGDEIKKTKNYCLKVVVNNEAHITLSEEVVRAYFENYGEIQDMYILSKDTAYIKFKYDILIDNIIEKCQSDKSIGKIFSLFKKNWEKVSSKRGKIKNEMNSSSSHIKAKIQTEKILSATKKENEADINLMSLENLEEKIFNSLNE